MRLGKKIYVTPEQFSAICEAHDYASNALEHGPETLEAEMYWQGLVFRLGRIIHNYKRAK